MSNSISRRDFLRVGGAAIATAPLTVAGDAWGRGESRSSTRHSVGLYLQESKEFQLKVKPPGLKGKTADRRQIDALLYENVKKAIGLAVRALPDAGGRRLSFPESPIDREAVRYDTSAKRDDGLLRKNWLSLAIEATDKHTKLKCKKHSFIPELLMDSAETSICHPKPKEGVKYGKDSLVLKLEQDLHLNNTKTCASGSLHLKGRRTDVKNMAFFSDCFPRLETLLPADTPLHVVQHWHETVFDDIEAGFGGFVFDNMMLVNRWDFQTGELLESELAYKVRKQMGEPWNYDHLRLASRFYQELYSTEFFLSDPPIFYYFDPVASVDIRRG